MVEPLNTKATGHDPKLVAALRSLRKKLEAMPEPLRGPFLVDGLAPYVSSPSLPVVDGGEVVATSWKYHDRVYVDFKFAPDPYALERGFLTDIEPLVRQSALLAAESRVLSLEEEVKRLREALKPFARIADMEEKAAPATSVTVNVNRCRDARNALKETGNG